MSTYPYLPDVQDEEDETTDSALSRKRLASFSRFKRPVPSQTATPAPKEKENSINTSNASTPGRKEGVETPKNVSIPKTGTNMTTGPDGKTATRSDVKETLKSMGLRCEDFTISVYSREQAHAILRRQGVEVTPNNLPSREKLAAMATKGGYRNARMPDMGRGRHNMRGVPPMNTWPTKTRPPIIRPQNTRKPAPPKYQADDDDDDCVILDPPDRPKPPKAALPQQFQLMGTTVQVNRGRGAKRAHRPMMHQPPAKRHNARPMQFYHKEHEEYGAEASVQDTLKRLKNYNISITCRRNASGLGPRGPMDSDSDMGEDGHMDSDGDEEDMTKYLECQIGEIEDIPEQEIYDEEDIDCDDKEDMDYNPRGKKKKNKSPRKGRRPMIPSVMLEQDMAETGVETVLDSSMENPLDCSVEIEEGKEPEDDEEQDVEGKDSSSPKVQDGEEDEEMKSPPKTSELSKDIDQEELDRNEEENMDDEEEKLVEEEEAECQMEEIGEKEEEEEQHTEETENQEEPNQEAIVEEEENLNEEENVAEKETEAECNDNDDEGETKEDNSAAVNESDANKTENHQGQEGHEDEEIDDELEKELLAGDVGDEELEEEL